MGFIEPKELENFLDTQSGERGISSLIKGRPPLLYWTLCRLGGHCRFLFKEFSIGNRYVADYVALNSYSGVWEVKFIELEPVNDPVFTKSGKPTNRFATAIRQVDDWARYFEDHKEQIREDLVRWAQSKDILGYSDGSFLCNDSGDYLHDSSSYLTASFHIFIGRRSALTREQHSRKADYIKRHSVEVATYDRLLDLARLRYKNKEAWLSE